MKSYFIFTLATVAGGAFIYWTFSQLKKAIKREDEMLKEEEATAYQDLVKIANYCTLYGNEAIDKDELRDRIAAYNFVVNGDISRYYVRLYKANKIINELIGSDLIAKSGNKFIMLKKDYHAARV